METNTSRREWMSNLSWNICRILMICLLLSGQRNAGLAEAEDVSAEYCMGDIFQPRCDHGEIIRIQQANYGRMRLGSCTTEDFKIGCKTDITAMIERLCAGRRECEVITPNREMMTLKPCGDMQNYVEVTYHCMPVISVRHGQCEVGDVMKISSPSQGYIASLTTAETSCGSEDSPWLLEAPQGQNIIIKMTDFAHDENRNSQQQVCLVYATIKEPSSLQATTVCGARERERIVYKSRSNTVEIEVVSRAEDRHFLLEYQFVGCEDMDDTSGLRLMRDGNITTVECDSGSDSTTYYCDGSNWIGMPPNCTDLSAPAKDIMDSPPVATERPHNKKEAPVVKVNEVVSVEADSLDLSGITWGMVLILVTIITAGMVACVLIIAVVYIKRRSQEVKQPVYAPSLGGDYETCDYEVSRRTSTVYRDGYRTLPKDYTPITPGQRNGYNAETWGRPLPPEPQTLPCNV